MGGFNSELSCGHVYIYTSKAYRYYFFFLWRTSNLIPSIFCQLPSLNSLLIRRLGSWGPKKKNKNSEERERKINGGNLEDYMNIVEFYNKKKCKM